jgi:CheY-like chemotaxis protein
MMVLPADILKASILIVDDQQANVRLLEQLLGDSGYTTVTSTMCSDEVCELHRQQDFQLILLDLKMPGMDGFAVMEALKLDEGNRYLPVIVLTAEPGHRQRALLSGARDFISKPFDMVEVKARIRNMLELRLLYQQLECHNRVLEEAVQQRSAELGVSEARYRALTELATDWYWEQNATGDFTTVCGPVFEMLGLDMTQFLSCAGYATGAKGSMGWNDAQRAEVQSRIAARQPFHDYAFSRANADGSRQMFRVSGEPIFDNACRCTGYRGVGREVLAQ